MSWRARVRVPDDRYASGHPCSPGLLSVFAGVCAGLARAATLRGKKGRGVVIQCVVEGVMHGQVWSISFAVSSAGSDLWL